MKLRFVGILLVFSSVSFVINDTYGQDCPSPDPTRTIHDYVVTPETCAGDNDGAVTITLNDGNPPFSQYTIFRVGFGAVDFEFFPPTNVVSFSNLSPGEYFIRVDHSSGCSAIIGFDSGGSGLFIDPGLVSVGGTLTAGGSTSICENESTPLLSLTGESGTVLRWERSFNAGPFTDIGNGGSITFSEVLATAGTYTYQVVVQNGTCPTDISSTLDIIVAPASNGGVLTPAGGTTICEGQSTPVMNLAGEAGVILRWERSNGGPFIDIGNGGSSSFSEVLVTAGTYSYHVVVQNGGCPIDISNDVIITVDPASNGGTLTAGGPTTICETGTTPLMTLAGELGTILRWERQFNGGGFVDIGNGGSNTFSEALAAAGTYDYQVVVQSGVCPIATSNIITITVDPTSVAGTLSATGPTTICEGSTADLSLAGETGTVIRWERQFNGGGFVDIGNGGSTTLSDPLATAGTYDYQLVVQSGVCAQATSNIVTFTVDPVSNGGTLTAGGPTTICETGTTPLMTLAGELGTILRWERQFNGGGFVDIGNGGSNTFSEALAAAGTYDYQVVVQSGVCPIATSNIITITVDPTS
ncbi:MAG: hypothetical protein IH947_14990, partial [Bacteroidetes bacterium]|nr:hypothetical protein [Bacteroidota bacterium]